MNIYKGRKRKLVVGGAKWCEQRAQEKAICEVIREAWRRAIAKADGEGATEEERE